MSFVLVVPRPFLFHIVRSYPNPRRIREDRIKPVPVLLLMFSEMRVIPRRKIPSIRRVVVLLIVGDHPFFEIRREVVVLA